MSGEGEAKPVEGAEPITIRVRDQVCCVVGVRFCPLPWRGVTAGNAGAQNHHSITLVFV